MRAAGGGWAAPRGEGGAQRRLPPSVPGPPPAGSAPATRPPHGEGRGERDRGRRERGPAGSGAGAALLSLSLRSPCQRGEGKGRAEPGRAGAWREHGEPWAGPLRTGPAGAAARSERRCPALGEAAAAAAAPAWPGPGALPERRGLVPLPALPGGGDGAAPSSGWARGPPRSGYGELIGTELVTPARIVLFIYLLIYLFTYSLQCEKLVSLALPKLLKL